MRMKCSITTLWRTGKLRWQGFDTCCSTGDRQCKARCSWLPSLCQREAVECELEDRLHVSPRLRMESGLLFMLLSLLCSACARLTCQPTAGSAAGPYLWSTCTRGLLPMNRAPMSCSAPISSGKLNLHTIER